MSEVPGLVNYTSADPVIGKQQDVVIERAKNSIQSWQDIMPRGRLLNAIHRARGRFKSGRVYTANRAIEDARADAEKNVRHVEEAISDKREQVPIVRAFFDTSSPNGVITISQLGDKEQTVAKSLQACIGRVVRQGYGIGHDRPLPLFDSQRTQPDSVEGNRASVTIAVLGELGLKPGDFARTEESTDEVTVMEAVTPFGGTQGTTDGPAGPDIRVRYRQERLDAALLLMVE